MPHVLLTKKEAAKRLRVSEKTLDRLRRKGISPPVVKIGSRVMYREDQLDNWIDGRTVTVERVTYTVSRKRMEPKPDAQQAVRELTAKMIGKKP